MSTLGRRSGEVVTLVVVGVVAVGLLGWLAAPRFVDGASRRADRSQAATSALAQATEAAEAAQTARSASASASLSVMRSEIASLPDTPSREFLSREGAHASTLLPAPDPAALLAAERRRTAILTGERDEARRLYEQAARDADRLNREASEARAELAAAQEARRAVDRQLSEAAAAQLALARRSRLQWFGLGLVALVCGYLWLAGLTPGRVGILAARIRAGDTPIAALDGVTTPFAQPLIRAAARREWERLQAEKTQLPTD